ncbi:unnamed protein product, partial [Nesidiocoris tenuis]
MEVKKFFLKLRSDSRFLDDHNTSIYSHLQYYDKPFGHPFMESCSVYYDSYGIRRIDMIPAYAYH